MVITDRYPLVQSKPFDLKATEEARVDLVLKKNPIKPKTKLTGHVTTYQFKPIYKATVKVLDRCYNPIDHTATNREGEFVFENILPPGDYKLTATAYGYKTAPTIDFSLEKWEAENIDIALKRESLIKKGSIYGMVTDNRLNQLLPDASIIFLDSSSEAAAETTSDAQGKYLLCGIEPGSYEMIGRKAGYFDSSTLIMVEEGSKIRSDIQLNINPEVSTGTISGLIDTESEHYKSVCVGLYKIEEGVETLIQTDTTNDEGLYLFAKVDPGIYVVKAVR